MSKDNIIVGTGLDLGGLQKGIKKMESEVATANKTVGSTKGGIDLSSASLAKYATVAGGVATALAGATVAVLKFADSIANEADEVGKASQRLGISLELYQKLESAAGHAGTSIGAMSAAMRTMVGHVQGVNEGSRTSIQLFDSLGVALNDTNGNLRDQGDLFQDSLLQLSRMENATQRNALAQRVFGRSAQDLIPLLNEGEEAIRRYVVANDSAVMVSEDLARASQRLNDAQQTIGETLTKARNEAFTPLIESMAELAEYFSKNIAGDWADNVGSAMRFASESVARFLKIATTAFGSIDLLLYDAIDLYMSFVEAQQKATLATAKFFNFVTLGTQQRYVDGLSEAVEFTKEIRRQNKASGEEQAKIYSDVLSILDGFSERTPAIEKTAVAIQKVGDAIKGNAFFGGSLPSFDSSSFLGSDLAMDVSVAGTISDVDLQIEQARERQRQIEEAKQQVIAESVQTIHQLRSSYFEAQNQQIDQELNAVRRAESEKMKNFKGTARARERAERESQERIAQAEASAEKRRRDMQVKNVVANTAMGIVGIWANAFDNYDPLVAVGLASAMTGLMTAQAVAQTAVIRGSGGGGGGSASGGGGGFSPPSAPVAQPTIMPRAEQPAQQPTGGIHIEVHGNMTNDQLMELENNLESLRARGRL